MYPTWLTAFVCLVVVRFGSVLAFYRPDVTAAKLAAGMLFQVVTLLPLVAIASTILWLAALAWRARLTFASACCVATHVAFAHAVVTIAIASMAGALLPESIDVQLRHPPFTSLAFLVDAEAHAVLHRVASELDVRSLYAVTLAGVGVRHAAGTTRGRAAGIVLTCFALAVATSLASATR